MHFFAVLFFFVSAFFVSHTLSTGYESISQGRNIVFVFFLFFFATLTTSLFYSYLPQRSTPQKAARLLAWTLTVILGFFTVGISLQYKVFVDAKNELSKVIYSEATRNWGGQLYFDGLIGPPSVTTLEYLLKSGADRVLVLRSGGGLISDAQKMAQIVKNAKLDIFVLEECSSACLLVALAGTRLFALEGARFGFHQAGLPGDNKSEVAAYWSQSISDKFFTDLKKEGVPQKILEIAKLTPTDQIHYLYARELKQLGMKIHLIKSPLLLEMLRQNTVQ
jgi:hypothetical protein